MDQTIFGIKEIYDCVLKPTLDIEFGGKTYKAHEPIIVFDKLQLADLIETKKHAFAKGGYGNQTWVSWDSTENLLLTFTQGSFSKTSLALLGNSNLVHNDTISIDMIEYLITESNGAGAVQVKLKHIPNGNLYIYSNTLIPAESYTIVGKVITFTNLAEDVPLNIYYTFDYINADIITIGSQGINGFLEFTAKTRLKDDTTGKTVTGIFKIDKLKLMSDFSIRLGNDVPPATGRFSIMAYPTGVRGKEKVAELIILRDDLDTDL